MADLSTPNATAPHGRLSATRAWRAGLLVAGTALAANLAVLAVAQVAGATMRVEPTGQPARVVGIGMVIPMTLAPVLLGTALLVGLRRRGPGAWRTVALIGLLIGVVTIVLPATAATGTGTGIALSSMHLLTGVAWFAGVRRTARVQEVLP